MIIIFQTICNYPFYLNYQMINKIQVVIHILMHRTEFALRYLLFYTDPANVIIQFQFSNYNDQILVRGF